MYIDVYMHLLVTTGTPDNSHCFRDRHKINLKIKYKIRGLL